MSDIAQQCELMDCQRHILMWGGEGILFVV